jgi:hypothetical protein
MQVSPLALQALRVPAILDSYVAVEEGGLLCFDAMRGVWQYEGGALARQLQDAQAVCSSTSSAPSSRLFCST